jgi:cell division protein FtsB
MATLERLGRAPASAPIASAWRPRRAIAVALLLAAAIALLQVVLSSSFANTGEALQRLEERRAVLSAEAYDLEAEVAALASLERTERDARDRLGMVPAGSPAYIVVDVTSPAGPLLPRPLVSVSSEAKGAGKPWWRSLLKSLQLP